MMVKAFHARLVLTATEWWELNPFLPRHFGQACGHGGQPREATEVIA